MAAALLERSIAAPGRAGGDRLRVGLVVPTVTGPADAHAGRYELVGLAALQGALLGEQEALARARSGTAELALQVSSAPSVEAVERAARRLVAVEEVQALVGGVGPGDAEALARLSRELAVLFLNVGATSDLLRRDCSPHVFHVEASAAMYLDATVAWFSRRGPRRWFVLSSDDEEGRARRDRVGAALERHGRGGEVVGEAAARPEQPVYVTELSQIASSGADVVLVLLGAFDQVAFLSEHASWGSDAELALFPEPVTQTREYVAATALRSGGSGQARVTLWDATLSDHGAGELNARFASRFGTPMEPVSWSTYLAVETLVEAAAATGSLEPDALAAWLADADSRIDGRKPAGLSFRAWDHQLRQPLYVAASTGAPWSTAASQRTAVAEVVGALPFVPAGSAPDDALLDTLGDGPGPGACGG